MGPLESTEAPVCPHCGKEQPVPGLFTEKYVCQDCKKEYHVSTESVRIFKTWGCEDVEKV